MTDVEQKVVQMRFDDKEFDEKARKTMKTLDKLADKLSFDEVAKRSDAAFKEVTENVEKIADQAYTIIDRVIDKIRNDIADKLVGYIKSATIDQVANGWQKYSDMTTAVGTLLSQGHKIEKVNKTLEDLSYFADETSYSFNDMLSGISKFTASGVKLEDAKVALMGISNWAAQSGQNAETASHVFGQLAQAMGSYMKKQDWQSVQTANMDTREFRQTALDTAVAMGTLKKVSENTYVSLRAATKAGAQAFTIDDFANSLTQGAWMTSEVMTETYKKYAVAVEKIRDIYEENQGEIKTGEIIRERQKINKEIIEEYKQIYNVTEETAKKELDKWSSVKKATDEEVKNYATLNKISEELADKKINANYYNAVEEYSKRTRKSMLETEKDLEQWSEYVSEFSLKAFLNAQEARTFTDVINSVKESASSAWREIYTAIFGDYNEAKVLWTDLAEGLIGIFTDRLYSIAEMFTEWKGKEDGGRTTMLQGMYAFGGGIKMFIDEIRGAWDDLISDGKSGVEVLQSISRKIQEAGFKFYLFMEALRDNGVIQNIAEALHNIKSFIDQVFGALYDGVRDAIPGGNFFLTLLKDFTTLLKDLTANFKLSDTALEGLRKTFKGVFIILNHSKKTIMDLLIKVVLPVLNVVFSVLGNIMDVVLTLTGTIGDIIEYFMPLDGETSGWIKALSTLADILGEVIKLIGNGLSWALQKIIPLIGVAIGSVVSLGTAIGELFNTRKIKMGSGSNLMKGFSGLKDKILEAWEPLKSFTEIIDQYKDGKGLTNFLNLFTDITEGIGNRLLLTMDATVGFLEVLGESKFGKVLTYAVGALRWVIRAGLWLFNNLLVPALKEIVRELGLTIESVKGIIEKDGILGLLKLIQEFFKTGIFGEIVNTINLINNVIGSNGLGRIFSKGAKALESISDYFKAAKLDAAANVLLKVIAAVALLYTLLALITFLPADRYEQMKSALIDMSIALAAVVGAVFVISAAAALAGGNLIAMAAGFVGVAIAIYTALWALKKMVAFADEVETTKIENGIKNLEAILSKYGLFIAKIMLPLAIVGAKYNGDIGGVGIAMAGLAASIWILLKALESIDNVDVTQLDKLFQFLSGIYAVLAASTALMVLAARGQTVHGISIAIASVGVAFAAIKMIFPLCKDIIAEKDTFMDGQGALLTFGAFMLSFAAAMYLVTSGVHGILSGIASILLFKGFLNIIVDNLFPVIEKFVDGIVKVANVLQNSIFASDSDYKIEAVITAALLIIGTFILLFREFRLLFDIWTEMDTVSIVAVAVSIIGSILAITYGLIPAIRELNEVTKSNSILDNGSLIALLFLAFSPIFVIMWGFSKIMDRYTELYGKYKNAKYSLNIGLITREFNAAASVMQSVMLTVLGVYVGVLGLFYMASKLPKAPKENMEAIMTILGFTLGILLLAIVPMLIFFGEVMSNMYKQLEGAGNINRKTFMAIGKANLEDTFTAVIRSIAQTIQIVAGLLPIVMLAVAALSAYIVSSELTDKFQSVFSIIGGFLIGVLAVVAIIVFKIMSSLQEANNLLSSTNLTAAASYKNITEAIAIAIFGAAAIFGEFLYAAYKVADMKNDAGQYDTFVKSLKWLALTLAAILGGMYLFIKGLMSAIGKNPLLSSYSGSGIEKQFGASWIPLLVAVSGMAVLLLIIGQSLLPAVKKLWNMNLDKIIAVFTGVVGSLLVSVIGMIAVIAIGAKEKTSVFSEVIQLLKVAAMTILPMVGLAIMLGKLADVLESAKGLDSETISHLKWMAIIVGAIGLVAGIIGSVAGSSVHAIAGIAALAALVAALGLMAYLIAIAAEKIYSIYVSWTGMTKVIGKMHEVGKLSAVGYAKGIEEGTAEGMQASKEMIKASLGAAKDEAKVKSPSKEFEKLGKFCDQGLAKGIDRNTKDVIKASRGLADITESVFSDELEIASPSKVFYKNGRFIVAGLQDGITSQKSSLADTMSGLGESLSKSIEDGFSGLDIDIFGGKTLEDFIHEFTGGEDAGSILGKMFGLDDQYGRDKKFSDEYLAMAKQVGDAELERLAYIESRGGRTPDWFANRFVDKNFGDKIGSKLSSFLKSGTLMDIVSKAGEALGITAGESATSETVFNRISEKILGSEDNRTGLGKIYDDIKNGNWESVGESIGTGLGTGLIKTFGGFVDVAKGLLRSIGLGSKNLDYYADIKEFENGASYWSMNDNFDLDIAELEAGDKLVFTADSGIDTSKLIKEINKDFEPRMKDFINAIGAPVWDEVAGRWVYTISKADKAAIDQLFKDWGVASPSKVSRYVYKMVGEGGVDGIESETPKLIKAMEDQNSEEYRTMSLGLQAIDQLADPDALTVQPRLVPIIDTASMAAFTGITDAVSGVNGAKISASLDYTGSMSFLAAGQAAIVSAVDAMKRDLLNSLSLGELVKVDVNSTVNDNNLFDHFVSIDRQEYNRTGRHAW